MCAKVCAGVVCVALMAVPWARGGTLFEDDFNDGNADGWDEYDGVFQVVNGEYEIFHDGTWENDSRTVAQTQDWTDIVFEADLRSLTEGFSAALLFRVEDIAPGRDAGHYYQFSMNSKMGLVLFCRIENVPGCTHLAAAAFTPAPDVTYRLRLEVAGASGAGYINDALMLTFDGFTDYPTGRIGLKFNGGTGRFDNVRVTPEPSGLGLLGLGALAAVRGRRVRKPA